MPPALTRLCSESLRKFRGHIKPSRQVLAAVRDHITVKGEGLVDDHYISRTGDDIAILMPGSGKGTACAPDPGSMTLIIYGRVPSR